MVVLNAMQSKPVSTQHRSQESMLIGKSIFCLRPADLGVGTFIRLWHDVQMIGLATWPKFNLGKLVDQI